MRFVAPFTKSLARCFLALSLSAAPCLTGCAAMLSVGNPAAAVKITEDAGLGVVVRRAEAAVLTASEVDRLLLITPVGGKAKWPAKVLINQADAQRILLAASRSGTYVHQPADVLPVEVWANLLPKLEASGGAHPSLLARIDPNLAEEYGKVLQKYEAFTALRESVVRAEEELDDKQDTLDDQAKASKEAKIEELRKNADQAEEAFDEAKHAFVDLAKTAAQNAPSDVRDETGPVVTRLREAVSDADMANGAAMVRYPLAVSSLVGDSQRQASIFLADVVEEKTGKRPDMQGVKPTVAFDGVTPTIGINGLTSKHLGKLNVADVTSEAVGRTTDWISKAVSLMVWAPSTSSALAYQADVLDAILEGYEASGWRRPEDLGIEAKEAEAE